MGHVEEAVGNRSPSRARESVNESELVGVRSHQIVDAMNPKPVTRQPLPRFALAHRPLASEGYLAPAAHCLCLMHRKQFSLAGEGVSERE